MKNVPNIYVPENFHQVPLSLCQKQLQDGTWTTARPEGFNGLCIATRLKAAWMVFTGRWDALRWEGQ